MAGEWLKFDCSLPEKPETLAITVAMGWDDPDLTVGKLMRLFRWFDQHTVDGNAQSVTPALLDRIIGVTGFTQAVARVGWIVIKDGAISLHNFSRHNGATAKSRAQTAKRVANHKANASGNGEGNAESVSDALPREEKRREDISPSLRSGESADKPRRPPGRPKSESKTLATYLEQCRAASAKPIPDNHSIRRWASDAGIQPEMLQVAWLQFRERYTEGEKGKGKRYKDWPAHFATAVKDNWFGLWYASDSGMSWSSKGLTHKTVLDARMAQQEADHAPA